MGQRLGCLFAHPRHDGNSIVSEHKKRIMSVSDDSGQLCLQNAVEQRDGSVFVQVSHRQSTPSLASHTLSTLKSKASFRMAMPSPGFLSVNAGRYRSA